MVIYSSTACKQLYWEENPNYKLMQLKPEYNTNNINILNDHANI